MTLSGAGRAPIKLGGGLLGYVLGHADMSWTIGAVKALRPGATLTVRGESDHGESVRQLPSPRRGRGRRRALVCLLMSLFSAAAVRADNAVIPDTPEQLGLRGGVDGALQLQVFINGRDTKQIVALNATAPAASAPNAPSSPPSA